MKYVFIINERAGTENSKAKIQDQINALTNKIDYEIYLTKAPKDATAFVKEYCENNADEEVIFVACGGDGTVNEVASALAGEINKSLAILAFGSGNDFIKCYKSLDFTSVEKLVNGVADKIDIIKVNNLTEKQEYYSINVCNFGFDAVVGSTANKVKLKGGKDPYGAGIRTAILKGRFNKITVISDGEKITKKKMLLCTLANGNYVGGKFFCAPKAVNNDGLIDVCLMHTRGLFSFLKILTPYTNGEHLDTPKFAKTLAYRQAKKIEFFAKKPFDVCIDGEMIKGERFTAEIMPKAINLILPRE